MRTQEKKSGRQISGEYLDWALENFSGYLAADEIHDGPFWVLFKEDVLVFFRKVDMILSSRRLVVVGVTTDASPLYPKPMATV